MTENAPTVSVIIPTYNRAHLVGRAIQSVLNQTYQDFEIIVVDDASTDNTEEAVNSFNDARIHYLRHERNRGGSAARNTGIKASRGEYIAFLDSDDAWLPGKIAYQMDVFKKAPSSVIAILTDCLKIINGSTSAIKLNKHNIGFKALLSSNTWGPTSSILLRKEVLEVIGHFDESLPSAQDYDMWLRLAKNYKSNQINIISTPLVRIHQQGGDRISGDIEAKRIALEIITEKHKDSLPFYRYRRWKGIWIGLVGYRRFLGGNSKGARELVRKGLWLWPFSLRTWLYYLASFINLKSYLEFRSFVRSFGNSSSMGNRLDSSR